jgi:hypothetical protein
MGETFEKFLGTKDYDDKVLLPFEGFLHASFRKYYKWNGRDRNLPHSYLAAEDCAARSLTVKPEQAEDGKVETTKEREGQGEVVKEKILDSHDGSDNVGKKGKKAQQGKVNIVKTEKRTLPNFKISSQTSRQSIRWM